MKFIDWLNQRRKALVPFALGILAIAALVLKLSADGNLSNDDWQVIIAAIVTWLGTTYGVHQATNTPVV